MMPPNQRNGRNALRECLASFKPSDVEAKDGLRYCPLIVVILLCVAGLILILGLAFDRKLRYELVCRPLGATGTTQYCEYVPKHGETK